MMKNLIILIIFSLLLTLSPALTAQQKSQNSWPAKPNIQHGINYHQVSDISQYYVSEKLDGVRGYWNGKQLVTRQGNLINSPHWFSQDWPTFAIDGELWIDRGQFQAVLSCVSKQNVETNKQKSCWKRMRFMMFDLPWHQGAFTARVKQMQSLLIEAPSPYLAMINQIQLKDLKALDAKLNTVIAAQGEGLMLHLASAHYKVGRNSALMKFKKNQDAEAIVIGHTEGNGKYQGKLGAVIVQTPNGIVFKIGSGFSDIQRANPPEIGTTITFKYNGLTDRGVPRFARFWRIKSNEQVLEAKTSLVDR